MARAFSGALVWCCILLALLNPSTADVNVEAPGLESFKEELEVLGRQVRDAEAGKAEAQLLLEKGKERQNTYAAEIKSLKKSLSTKDKHESALQSQIALLQEEAKKLQSDEELHRDLKEKFQAVSSELEATKETLATTLKQLADRSTSASTAESQVQEAERKLKSAQEELKELQSNAQDASKVQKQLQQEQSKIAKLEATVTNFQEEVRELKSKLSDVQSELKATTKDASTWKSKAERAEKAVASAQVKLDNALKEHSATQAALLQAEASAQEAMGKLEVLLTSWLPHWLDHWYNQLLQAVHPAVKRVQPTLDSAWKQGKIYSKRGHANAWWAYGVTKAKTVSAWKSAEPTVNKAVSDSKKHLSTFSEHVGKVSAPHLKALRAQSFKAYQASEKAAVKVLSHPQVMKVRRTAERTIWELENVAISKLKKVPALKQFAGRPFVTYLVYAALSAPFLTVLIPVLLLRGSPSKSKTAKRKSEEYDTRRISQRDDVPPEQNTKAGKPKKVRRISVGSETVRVP